ncbi:MAG: tRNA 4-thiouridine(8) synthase ThiI [Pseudomonadota bacterium]|uniref:tRNA 4-thiouridine(8) synthase ThiI n=1 Tax=Candidatus Desulfatibia profunda TaxID=2841695 RepID=A0A8J6TIJ7_9BACT|nr:tRNA 4-thiouridine(8) synthase ThiI [Candidatus Desulfatibia profunda]
MNLSFRKVRALGLCSGGLDSMLSALGLRNQGIEVQWVSFETPFFSSEKARLASDTTGIPLTVKNITQVYLKMLKDPHCGYGKNMNPCMDCHALMFRLAGTMMRADGFDFLFSGEVLGQRPMSQNKQSLRYVEKQSGYDGYILRPLSAKRLPETIPEKEGMVNRELLLDISGRSRKVQIKLAKKFGIKDYPSPAGGCLLTDKVYSGRLKDLFEHQKTYTEAELYLLGHGRHLRLDEHTKIIVGRTQQDNANIIKYHNPKVDTVIKVKNYPGPIVLMPRGGKKESLILAASICAGYSKASDLAPVEVQAVSPLGRETIKVLKIPPQEVKHLLI